MAVYITQALAGDKLKEIAEVEDSDDVQMALDALIDAEPKFEGQEFVCFVGTRVVVEAGDVVQPRRAFKIKSGSTVAEDDDDVEVEEEPEEEEVAPKPKRKPAAKRKAAPKKAPARKPAAAKKTTTKGAGKKITPKATTTAAPSPKPGSRAGSTAGKKTPFTSNPASAELPRRD